MNFYKMVNECQCFLMNPFYVLSGNGNHPDTSRMSSQRQLLHHLKDSTRP